MKVASYCNSSIFHASDARSEALVLEFCFNDSNICMLLYENKDGGKASASKAEDNNRVCDGEIKQDLKDKKLRVTINEERFAT